VFIACDSESVADWATAHAATVLWHPGVGLNAAVNNSVADLRRRGADHVVVAHGDLPLATDLSSVITAGTLTLVPDARDDGTNVAALPAEFEFEFEYGAGSFNRHLSRAVAAGLPVGIRRDVFLALDIDTPTDLTHPLVQEVLPAWLPTNLVNLTHHLR